MTPSIVVVATLAGAAVERIEACQRATDPRMAAEMPPHVTLVGSSGVGPIDVRTDVSRLAGALAPVASATPAFDVALGAPMRFMQSRVVVLPIDPNGPFRALHDAIVAALRAARIPTSPARFTFTPHVTLNLYRELAPGALRELLAFRAPGTATIADLVAYRAENASRSVEIWKGRVGSAA